MTVAAWEHLPNAAHIDCILQSLPTHAQEWETVGQKLFAAHYVKWSAAYTDSRTQLWNSGRHDIMAHSWYAIEEVMPELVPSLSQGKLIMWEASFNVIRGSIFALAAWDNYNCYLTMTPEQLAIWNALNPTPAGILLEPMIQVQHVIKQLNSGIVLHE